jgi:DNA-binding CsgD family transcriptional regulator
MLAMSTRTTSHAQAQRGESEHESPQAPSHRQLDLLRLIAEQHAIPIDQLARFLGCSIEHAEQTVLELDRLGCIEHDQFLVGDSRWVWLNGRARRLTATPHHGRRPKLSRLHHLRAVNETRLYLTERAPDATWVPAGAVARMLDPDDFIPDAVLRVGHERHAIEVELSGKPSAHLRRILDAHSARWDAVVYFCGPRARRLLTRMDEEKRWPKLVIRALPGELAPDADPPPAKGVGRPWPMPTASRVVESERRAPSHDGFEPPRTARELEILQFIAEQYTVPLDQLARFLRCSDARAKSWMRRLATRGYVEHGAILAGQPEWIWLTKGGNVSSRMGFNLYPVKVGGLERTRAVTDVRLHLAERVPQARWISRRSIRGLAGRAPHYPNAAIELNDERHAIEVELIAKTRERAARVVETHRVRYDAVVVYCNARTHDYFTGLVAEHAWPDVRTQWLPGLKPRGH